MSRLGEANIECMVWILYILWLLCSWNSTITTFDNKDWFYFGVKPSLSLKPWKDLKKKIYFFLSQKKKIKRRINRGPQRVGEIRKQCKNPSKFGSYFGLSKTDSLTFWWGSSLKRHQEPLLKPCAF